MSNTNNKDKETIKGEVAKVTSPEVVVMKEQMGSLLDNITGKYTIKLNPLKQTWLAETNSSHDGAQLFSKAFHSFSPGMFTTGLLNTGLTPELEKAFEKEMHLQPGTLSKYNKDYWSTYSIKIPKDGRKLDCDSNMTDKLAYLVLKAESQTAMGKVAMSMIELQTNAFTEYIVMSDEVEARNTKTTLNVKSKAFKFYNTMTIEDQKDFLRVYKEGARYKIGDNSKNELIESKVLEIVDNEPQEFLDLVQNTNYKDMLFLSKCFLNRLVNRSGSKYVTPEGEVIGNSYLDAIQNLQDPNFNAVKISLTTKLQALNK